MINDKYLDLILPEHKQSYTLYQAGKQQLNPYSSHQPVLIHTLNTIPEGRVLEFGMGWHSTPIMHTICEQQDRELVSVETDSMWFGKFMHYHEKKHQLRFFQPNELRKLNQDFLKEHFTIAFIDGAPGELRREMVLLMKDNVDYFVVHDTEEWVGKFRYAPFTYNWDFSGFKHQYHLTRGTPNSSLLSNLPEINKDLISVFV